ncbi:MAG: SDR family NAD(P)-dependent oxidoreductase, partial [Sediminibacterium sp.]
MNLSLENKVIIVSGGARGIGEGIVKTLLAEKAIPVVIDQRVSSIEGVKTIQADLTNPQACATAIENIAKEFGSIDGLVNNAGVNDGVNLANGNYQSFIDSLHKNLVHYYLLAHHALPYLKTSKGAIVNISSKTAETGQGGTSA